VCFGQAVNIPPNVEALFTGKEEEMFEKLTATARRAIAEDPEPTSSSSADDDAPDRRLRASTWRRRS
jgi:hypothetical protein